MQVKNMMIIYVIVLILTLTPYAHNKFPINTFFGLQDQLSSEYSQFLCHGSNKTGAKCCSCESNCMERKTCCIDKLWTEKESGDLDGYLEYFWRSSETYKDLVCRDVVPKRNDEIHQSEEILMIKSCMEGAEPSDEYNCIHSHNGSLVTIMPVLGADNYVYRNEYCARCNFVTTFQVLNITANCEMNIPVWTKNVTIPVTNFQSCKFSAKKSHGQVKQVKRCKRDYILNKTCSKNNGNYRFCKMYAGQMGGYANYHCLKCNVNDTANSYFNTTSCSFSTFTQPSGTNSKTSILNKKKFRVRKKLLRWSMLVTRSGLTMRSNFHHLNHIKCNQSKVYNFMKGRCVNLNCGPYYRKMGSKCVRKIPIPNPTFDKCFIDGNPRLFISYTKSKLNFSQLVGKARNSFALFNVTFSTFFENEKNTTTVVGNDNYNKAMLDDILSIYNHSTFDILGKFEMVGLSSLKQPPISNLHLLDITRLYPGGKVCADSITLSDNIKFSSNCDVIVNGSVIPHPNTSLWIEMSKYDIKRKVFVCRQFYLQSDCPTTYPLQNVIINDNKSLVSTVGNLTRIYSPDEYLPLKEGYGICTPEPIFGALTLLNTVEGYISLIGTCLSICCYIFILITFTVYKSLQNVAGWAAIGLCSCLLFTDILFLIATVAAVSSASRMSRLCAAVGILLHYGLLAAHLWTLLIAIYIALKFHRLIASKKENTKTIIHRYCFIAFSLPFIVVVCSVILDYTGTLKFGYGKYTVCFITSFYAKLAFYIVPSGLIFLVNIVLLISFVHNVTRKSKRKRTSNQNELPLSIIVFRLTILFGLSEMIGLFQIPYSNLSYNNRLFNAVFSLIYSTFRSLRGVMLFIAYICKRKVLTLYKKTTGKIASST